MEVVIGIGAVLFLALVIRLIAGAMDDGRVKDYIENQGGEVVDKEWRPFGPGWAGKDNSRIYAVTYRDKDGDLRRAHAKTSLLSGVYLTEDETIEPAPQQSADEPTPEEADKITELRDENERLRARIRELEDESA